MHALERLTAERDQALAEREQALAEIRVIRASPWWRITAPLRAVVQSDTFRGT